MIALIQQGPRHLQSSNLDAGIAEPRNKRRRCEGSFKEMLQVTSCAKRDTEAGLAPTNAATVIQTSLSPSNNSEAISTTKDSVFAAPSFLALDWRADPECSLSEEIPPPASPNKCFPHQLLLCHCHCHCYCHCHCLCLLF